MTPSRSCTACATPLPRDAAFCPTCGAATPTEFEPTTGTEAAPVASDTPRPSDAALRRAQLQHALGAAFELKELVGQGGFGEVWAAWDVRLKRDVAVKVLLADLAASPGLHTRFAREAEAAARLRHPNIIPIYQVGEADGLAYIIMPLVQGESLRAVLQREGALPIAVARRILAEAAHALEAAHKAGLVHRDVKPENIMLEGEDRRVLLMDFGIARAMEEDAARLTGTGLVIGTPQYMSPEQATAEKHIDHRADIYSLGVVAYEALTGVLPFEAESTRDLIVHHLTKDPKDPRATRAEIPEDVADAILKCMAKEPDERWASAGALAAVLQPLVVTTEQSPLRWVAKRLGAGIRKSKRRIVVYLTALAAVLVTLAIFSPSTFRLVRWYWTGTWRQWHRPPAAPVAETPRRADFWSVTQLAPSEMFEIGLSPVGDTLVVARSPGQAPVAFDGTAWRTIAVPGHVVLPPVVARGGARWLYAWNGIVTVGYELTAAGPVARDTVRGNVQSAWSDGRGGALLGLRDGGMLRGQPGAWRREPTGTATRLTEIWGDARRQVALGLFARPTTHTPDSLLVFNGLNWRTIDPRPDSSRRWVYNAGAVLADGTLLVAGADCAEACRGLLARLAPGATEWRAMSGMPERIEFITMLAAPSGELWLAGRGDGCLDATCAFHVADGSVAPVATFGQDRIVGLALLRGELVATTAAGLLWTYRGGVWGLLGVVPGSLATGLVPGAVRLTASVQLPPWSDVTVIRDGVAGVRRVADVFVPGRSAGWYEGRPTAWYRLRCSAGESLLVAVAAPWDNMVALVDERGREGGRDDDHRGHQNALLPARCPEGHAWRVAVFGYQADRVGNFQLTVWRGGVQDTLRAPAPAAIAGTVAPGETVSGTIGDPSLLRHTYWLATSGGLYVRECRWTGRCGDTEAVPAPEPLRDIVAIGVDLLAAGARRTYRQAGSRWDPIAADGMGPAVALAEAERGAGALTADAVWVWSAASARWRHWQAVPDWVGVPRVLVLAPNARAAVVIGERSTALLRDSLDAVELEQRSVSRPTSAVVLDDGRIVLAFPSADPLVRGSIVVFARPPAAGTNLNRIETPPPGHTNVYGLTADANRLYATGSGWTVLSRPLRDLPFAADTTH